MVTTKRWFFENLLFWVSKFFLVLFDCLGLVHEGGSDIVYYICGKYFVSLVPPHIIIIYTLEKGRAQSGPRGEGGEL